MLSSHLEESVLDRGHRSCDSRRSRCCGCEPATFEKLGFPIFEKMGFPITLHQVQVVGPAHVQERSPTPTLTLAGMPASPHQVAVLGPRPKMTEQKISMDRK